MNIYDKFIKVLLKELSKWRLRYKEDFTLRWDYDMPLQTLCCEFKDPKFSMMVFRFYDYDKFFRVNVEVYSCPIEFPRLINKLVRTHFKYYNRKAINDGRKASRSL